MRLLESVGFITTFTLVLAGCATHPKQSPMKVNSPVRKEEWGLSCLSIASAREQPAHKAELATQILMGEAVRILQTATNHHWCRIEAADGYRCWLEEGTFTRCTREQVDTWNRSSLLIVTVLEDCIYSEACTGSRPVSDVVVADLVKRRGEQDGWYEVELPDGRSGFLQKGTATDLRAWKRERKPTAENLEQTAVRLLGRPYLWGGNSPKGLDCSGFTKLVFFLNGIALPRNARDQSHEGTEVPIESDLRGLRKGDLLFFGKPARRGQPERITHTGIYLGDNCFIQSSECVKISSLDPASPICDLRRARSLLRARRVLPE